MTNTIQLDATPRYGTVRWETNGIVSEETGRFLIWTPRPWTPRPILLVAPRVFNLLNTSVGPREVYICLLSDVISFEPVTQ